MRKLYRENNSEEAKGNKSIYKRRINIVLRIKAPSLESLSSGQVVCLIPKPF